MGRCGVTVQNASDVYYDPYDVDVNADPYPVFRRLREEAPLYYNESHDFYAVSRFADVERGYLDPKTFISGRGGIIELIRANVEMPSGVLIFEDPPVHTIHRRLMSRVFSPNRVAALEPQIREFCARCLDPLVGAEEFDLIADLGAQMPMRVIGMLLGIPDRDQEAVRDRVDANLRTDAGQPMKVSENFVPTDMFADYIDWRAEHPSDDIMTELLQAEFEDETGTVRHLTRDELLTYIGVIAGAGNETTGRLIGWTGKVLADHPDQRKELVDDRSLIPNAIEEVLRFETPAPHAARYVAQDVELYGTMVREGNIIMLLPGSANHDDRRFPDGDTFNIHRRDGKPLTFGFGIHLCLGAALARLEGRVALEEVLDRFPTWEVDMDRAKLAPTSTVRGWETLPVLIS
jgi:cytochrome P450